MQLDRLTALVIAAITMTAVDARADGAADEAIAVALFAEGRRLAEANDLVHACEKFEAARNLQPWLGIELNLADCYERLGRTASAWVTFRKASDDADKLVDPRASFARERAIALEPKLSHLTIEATGGAQIVLDHQPVASAELGVPLPVDPGDHIIEATAAGHLAWSRTVVIEAASSIDIRVPALELPPPPPPTPASALRTHRARRGWVLVIGGAGVAAVGTSLLLGLDAKLRYDDAVDAHCDAQLLCDPHGLDTIRVAKQRGNIATIVGGAGLAAVAAALVVRYTAPIITERMTVAPMTSAIGLTVQGQL